MTETPGGGFWAELRERRAVRWVLSYGVAAWFAAQVIGFFVEQGYVGRTLLDITLFLLVVGFVAVLIGVWYHGERGHQPVSPRERWLFAALALAAIAGTVWLAGRSPVSGEAGGTAFVELGDSSVAVLPFENDLTDPELAWLDRGIADLLATNLSQQPHLRIVSGQRLFDILKQLGQSELRLVPEELQARVTRAAGARYLVNGRIAGSSGAYLLIATLIDARTGEIAGAARAQGSDVFELVDRVSAEVLPAGLAGVGAGSRPVAQLTTPNLEAYAEFQRGHEARLRFLMDDAERHFRAAVALDSSFALAHFQLAGVQVTRGDIPGAMASLRRARENLSSANERDRLFIEGLGAMIEGDLDTGQATLTELISKYPDDKEARLVLANMLRGSRRDPALSRRLLEEAVALDPSYGPAFNSLAYDAVRRGDHDSAIALIERYVELGPGQPNPLDSRGEILELAGRDEEAREAYRAALAVRPTFTLALRHLVRSHLRGSRPEGALEELAAYRSSPEAEVRVAARRLTGDAYVWEGRFDAAFEAYEGAAVEAEAADLTGQRANAVRALLFTAVQLGRDDLAAASAETLDRIAAGEGTSYLSRVILAGERGDTETVREAIAEFESRFAEDPNVQPFLGQIRVMFATYEAFYRDDYGRVIELADAAPFAEADSRTEYLAFPVLRSLLALERAPEALAQLDIARRAGVTGIPGQFEPLVERLLQYFEGRARTLTGDREGAIAAYEALVEGWGDAAAEAPWTEDLEARLAELREGAASP